MLLNIKYDWNCVNIKMFDFVNIKIFVYFVNIKECLRFC